MRTDLEGIFSIDLPALNFLTMKYNFDLPVDRDGTSCVKFDLRERIFGKSDVLPMWVADMDFETPDFIREAVMKRASHPIYGYTFREADYFEPIIAWMKSHHNWTLQRNEIIFCPGVVPALNFAVLTYTNPGDQIIVQPPVYFPFFGAVSDHERELVYNQLVEDGNTYRINFEQLEEQAKTAKMLILCNPHNPVGRCWTREELERIADICLKNKVLVLSDEIHADLVMTGYQHQVFAALSPEIADITITTHAPSKTFNLAGLATSSVIISNPELRKLFSQMMEKMHLWLGNLFGNIASKAAYSHGEPWRSELIEYVNDNISLVDDYLRENIPAIRMFRPEATYMIWLDFRQFGLDDESLKHKLIHEAGLGFNAGTDFGPGGSGFMRMNVACPRAVVVDALERLRKVFG